MKDPLLNPGGFFEASELVDFLRIEFSCPFCRSVMGKRPIPSVHMEEVICMLGIREGGEVEVITEERLRQANDSFEQYLLF